MLKKTIFQLKHLILKPNKIIWTQVIPHLQQMVKICTDNHALHNYPHVQRLRALIPRFDWLTTYGTNQQPARCNTIYMLFSMNLSLIHI